MIKSLLLFIVLFSGTVVNAQVEVNKAVLNIEENKISNEIFDLEQQLNWKLNNDTFIGISLIEIAIKYDTNKLSFEISKDNILNPDWNETQFETDFEFQNETECVCINCISPEKTLFAKAKITYRF